MSSFWRQNFRPRGFFNLYRFPGFGHFLFVNTFENYNGTKKQKKSILKQYVINYTGLSKKMDGIWNRYNLKSTGRIYTFGVLKCSEKVKILDLP